MNDKEQLSIDERKETLSIISRFFSPKFGEQTKDGKRAGMAISQNNFIKLIPVLTCYANDEKKSTDASALITLAQQFGLHKGVEIPRNFYEVFSQVCFLFVCLFFFQKKIQFGLISFIRSSYIYYHFLFSHFHTIVCIRWRQLRHQKSVR